MNVHGVTPDTVDPYAQAFERLRKHGPMRLPSGFSTGVYQVRAVGRRCR